MPSIVDKTFKDRQEALIKAAESRQSNRNEKKKSPVISKRERSYPYKLNQNKHTVDNSSPVESNDQNPLSQRTRRTR